MESSSSSTYFSQTSSRSEVDVLSVSSMALDDDEESYYGLESVFSGQGSNESYIAEFESEGNLSDESDVPCSEDNITEDLVEDAPLFAGSQTSFLQAVVLILQFALRYQLSSVAFDDLLKLFSFLLPSPNLCVKSVYSMKKLFASLFPHIGSERHMYCTFCHSPLTGRIYCHGECNVREFVIANVEAQLKAKFKDEGFCQLLQSRHLNHSDRSDIYDGEEYKKLSSFGGFLCKETNPLNVSFIINTDGVPLFKSSNTSIWPIFLIINELPAAIRFHKQNVLLGGVWYDTEKPTMSTFLEPLVNSLRYLFEEGKLLSQLEIMSGVPL